MTTVRGPYRTGIRRRRDILEAAVRVFGQFGYVGGSLRQIADQVGVTPAALIRHFGSKENLLVEVLKYWNEETNEITSAGSDGEGPTGLDFFRIMESVMRYHTTHRGLLELFLTLTVEATNPDHPARAFIADRYSVVVDEGTAALARAIHDGEARPMSKTEIEWEVRSLFAAMDGLEIQWLLDPHMDLVATFRHALEGILIGWRKGL
jgi:AcrR family transcriptional regulator